MNNLYAQVGAFDSIKCITILVNEWFCYFFNKQQKSYDSQINDGEKNREYFEKSNKISGVGLPNLGNTCYMNSCLQIIFLTEPLMNDLMSIKHKLEDSSVTKSLINLTESLVNIKYNESRDKIFKLLNNFIEKFFKKHPDFKYGKMCDANLFLMTLFSDIQSDTKHLPEDPISKIFYTSILSKTICEKCCKVMDSRKNDYLELSINPLTQEYENSVYDFENLLINELLTEKRINSLKPCDLCQCRTKLRQNEEFKFPEVLIVKFEKTNEFINFPEYLDLSKYISSEGKYFY